MSYEILEKSYSTLTEEQQPLRLGAKKTEGAQKDCRWEMTRDYQLIKFTHSIGSFDKLRNRVVSVFWCSVCRNAVIAPLNVELVETRNAVIELVEMTATHFRPRL